MDKLKILITRRKSLLNEIHKVNSQLTGIYENCFVEIASGKTEVDDVLSLITNGEINLEQIRAVRRRAAVARSHEAQLAERNARVTQPLQVAAMDGSIMDAMDGDLVDEDEDEDNVGLPPVESISKSPTSSREELIDAIKNSDDYKRKIEVDLAKLNKFKEIHMAKSESERKSYTDKNLVPLKTKLTELGVSHYNETPRQQLARESDTKYYSDCIAILTAN